MEMLDFIYRWGGALVCSVVIIGVVCRLDALSWRQSRAGVLLMYMAFGAYAGGVAIDLASGYPVDWYEAAGVGGALLLLLSTWRDWRDGEAPPETDRPPLGEH